MSDLMSARSAMAVSLGFHIIFACIGMVMPILMAISHYKFLRTQEKQYLDLTKMWMKGVAIFFAVGAVSGTVLSFELGLLWPKFMLHAGPIIGMPFSWEGTAFFLEAIAIGLFLYGWDRMNPWVHWGTGALVALSGFASGIFVVAANSWMNTPSGFTWSNGVAANIDPYKAMFNPAWLHQTLHMQVGALQAVGLTVAGIHARLLLRGKNIALNRSALKIAMALGASASLIQPIVGHFSAQEVARLQPAKLAAFEGLFKTQSRAPIYLGGLPNADAQEVRGGIALPGLLSLLAFNSFGAEVKGLDQVPRADWPPLAIAHVSFQVMVLLGTFFAFLAVLYFYFLKKRKDFPRWYLWSLCTCMPLGFVAIEAGWILTETGRQPWIIYGILRTADAVTPFPGLFYHFALFFLVYLFLGSLTLWMLLRQISAAQVASGGLKE